MRHLTPTTGSARSKAAHVRLGAPETLCRRGGYRALFHGDERAQMLEAALALGEQTGREVVEIDADDLTAPAAGSIEESLARVLDEAAERSWILLFDEADALLGKRSGVQDAHDRYANLEVSHLLQALERHDGIVILTTNSKRGIDRDVLRRLDAVLEFPPR